MKNMRKMYEVLITKLVRNNLFRDLGVDVHDIVKMNLKCI